MEDPFVSGLGGPDADFSDRVRTLKHASGM